jgi:hypothetical protein
MNNNTFFKFEDKEEGNVSIGIIPNHLHNNIDIIEKTFYNEIPEVNKEKITYHKWCDDLNYNIKSNIDVIKKDNFWINLCNRKKCDFVELNSMDEIYYANPQKKVGKNLYGAVGNFNVHRDGHFSFLGVHIYRILIGITDGNTNVMTYLPNLNYGKSIAKYEYLAFDFDKTSHQVLINNIYDNNKYRIILKLHFMTCENCKLPKWYISFLTNFYTKYLKITRYIMENGTNPKTVLGFFCGVLSYIIGSNYNLLLSFFIFFIVLFILIFNTKKTKKKFVKSSLLMLTIILLLKTIFICIIIFLLIVLWEYLYFKITQNNKVPN